MEEEKKTPEVEEIKATEQQQIEEESDFADEMKPEVIEEVKVEEPKEPEVNLYAEPAPESEETMKEEPKQEEQAPVEAAPMKKGKKGKEVVTYVYDDPELQSIEDARKVFHEQYHKLNVIKWIITGAGLVLIIAGWVIPSLIQGLGSNITMYVALGVTALVLVGIAIYSHFFRKKTDAYMRIYFKDYYVHSNKYVYGDMVENLTGTVDDKLPQDLLVQSNIYKDVVKVGSRAFMNFTYKDHKGIVADAAAQKKGDRQLETLFVGKFLKFEGITSQDEVLIYLKGNKRALPPNSLKERNLIEDSRTMVVYGNGKARTLLTKKVREALAAFDTNKTFIDMAISVNSNGLFLAMGYEDDLMVLPLEKAFNPAPTTQNKNDMAKVFALVDAFANPHGEK